MTISWLLLLIRVRKQMSVFSEQTARPVEVDIFDHLGHVELALEGRVMVRHPRFSHHKVRRLQHWGLGSKEIL